MHFAQQLFFTDGVENVFISFLQCGDDFGESCDLGQFGYVVDVIFTYPGALIVNAVVEIGLRELQPFSPSCAPDSHIVRGRFKHSENAAFRYIETMLSQLSTDVIGPCRSERYIAC